MVFCEALGLSSDCVRRQIRELPNWLRYWRNSSIVAMATLHWVSSQSSLSRSGLKPFQRTDSCLNTSLIVMAFSYLLGSTNEATFPSPRGRAS